MKYFIYILIAGGFYAHLDATEKDMTTLNKIQIASLWPVVASTRIFTTLKIYTEKNK